MCMNQISCHWNYLKGLVNERKKDRKLFFQI